MRGYILRNVSEIELVLKALNNYACTAPLTDKTLDKVSDLCNSLVTRLQECDWYQGEYKRI